VTTHHRLARRPPRDEPQRTRSHRSIAVRQSADRPARGDCSPLRISRARVVDAGRIITAGGIASGLELGFHLLRRIGYEERFIREVARVMEYHHSFDLHHDDIEYAAAGSGIVTR